DVVVDQDQVAGGPVRQAGHGVVGDSHGMARIVLLDRDHEEGPDLTDTLDSLQARLIEHMPSSGGLGEAAGQTSLPEAQGRLAHDDRVVAMIDRLDLDWRLGEAGGVVPETLAPGALDSRWLQVGMDDLALEHDLGGSREGQTGYRSVDDLDWLAAQEAGVIQLTLLVAQVFRGG